MTGVGLIILFGASFLLFPCQGEITSPPDGTSLYFLNGSTANITWSFNDKISDVNSRAWYFTSSDGSIDDKRLGRILGDVTIEVDEASGLSGVKIERPASLILEHVNLTYNGTYRFDISAAAVGRSEVVVFIAMKPNVTINCSDPTTVYEEKDLTCVCRSEGGNPQANLTWYDKDGVQIGNASYGENILTLTNLTKQYSGRRYKCKGQSYILTDEESFEVKVTPNYKPNKTEVTIINPPAVVGKSVTVMCKSNGRPEPSYTIMHNDSITVSNQSTYFINKVKWNDTGRYKCIARNKLGSDSASKHLTVTEPTPATPPTSASTSAPTSSTGGLSTGVIIGIIIGVLVLIIIIVVVVVYYCKSIEKERSNSCANIDPVPGNGHELEEPGPSDGAYDTVWTSGSKSKAPVENALPPVYAAVDKNNRQGNTLYASLDNKALQSSRASKKEPDRPQQTEYASIDFAKTGNAPKTV